MKSVTSNSRAVKSPTTQRVKQQEATLNNVASPKGISKKTPVDLSTATSPRTAASKAAIPDLGKTRRRLSVVSDNDNVDGDEKGGKNRKASLEMLHQTVNAENCAVKAYAGITKKGFAPYNSKKKNQDSMVMEVHVDTDSVLFCVFDGHGEVGDEVSQFMERNFPPTLFKNAHFCHLSDDGNDSDDIKKAILETVQTLEKRLLRESKIDAEFSGTTAVMCVVRGRTLVVGNVGDSRISRGYTRIGDDKGKIIAEQVSDDHKPDRADEKQRILGVGGRVFAVEYDDGIDGPPRVWLPHVDVPGLAMSRSLGDTVAHTAGVSSDPEFFVRRFEKSDKLVVIATDGLWEFLKDQEVMDIIVENNMEPKVAADELMKEANARWMKQEQVIDDTTIIIANIEV